MTHAPVYAARTKGPSAYSVQIAIALVVLIIGFILFTIWVVIYANRLSNDLDIEWWLWLILGFGAALIFIALIWLVITGYALGSKGEDMLFELHRRNDYQRAGNGDMGGRAPDDVLEPNDYTRSRGVINEQMLGNDNDVAGTFVPLEELRK